MRNLGRATAVLGLVLAATTMVLAGPAGAAGKVGPEQYFTGVINGTDGNTATPIPIRVICRASSPTGHPAKGQTLAVHQLFPPTPDGSLGDTGNDSEIGVFFTSPPPSGDRARATGGSTVFTRYDKPKPLPTSLTLPCGGTKTVWFSPIPVVPPSQSATVPVEYVSEK
jgi:hypothetical protein